MPVIRLLWCTLVLVLGFTFFCVPILTLVICSFNSSKPVTAWAGRSTRWYDGLFHDDATINAVGLGLIIVAYVAMVAAILGIIAAAVVARSGRPRGLDGFAFTITVPLVMPGVIIDLSPLLLFVVLGYAIGWPLGCGMLIIWLVHVTSRTAYVAVVISSWPRELDHSIGKAAVDLGAVSLKVFFVITLPMTMSAVISSWLPVFTLLLGDLVIASFAPGPGAMTLSMLVFSSIRMEVNPEINTLATFILDVVGTAGLIAWYLIAHAGKQRVRDI